MQRALISSYGVLIGQLRRHVTSESRPCNALLKSVVHSRGDLQCSVSVTRLERLCSGMLHFLILA